MRRRLAVSIIWISTLLAPAAATAQEAASPAGDDIIVTGTKYRGNVATGGARIDVPTKDLPLSISVLTDALIQDRQVRNIRDLADNVAGVRSRQSGSGAFSIDFTIRGLQGGNGSVVAVNGFRVENFSSGFDPQAVDRVEFLKGPASVLYGASGALSGLVNIVTKTPESSDFLTLDATGGTRDYGRATLDGNVRLSDTLDSRTNVAITHDTVPNAFRKINEQFAMQSFRWHPGDFSIVAEGSYFHAIGPSRDSTQYPELARFFALPKDLKLGEAWDRNINTGYSGRFDASWKITPNLTLRQGINYQYYHEQDFDTALYTADTFDTLLGPNLVGRSLRRGDATTKYIVSQSEVRWDFATGSIKHKLLAGFEYGNEKSGGICCSRANIAPLDLTNPVYGAPEPIVPLTDYFMNTIHSKAFYLQDFIEFRTFKLLAGIRRDDTSTGTAFCSYNDAGCPSDPVVANASVSREKAFSPRLGLAWQPNNRTTLFISWSKSFNPDPALDRNNKILPPERGIQYEAGIRQELLRPGQLTLSASVFDLTRRNIGDCDPLFPDCSRLIAIGEQRIKGAEAELAGKPIDWIDVIATYSYIHGRVTKSDFAVSGIAEGSKLPEAAPNSASLFTKITLTPIGLPEFAVSAGAYYVDKRPSRDYFSGPNMSPYSATILELPSSTRIDLGAYWEASAKLRVQANITNVFDTRVYEPVNAGFNISQPFRATIGVHLTL